MNTRADRPLLLGVRHHGPGSARAVRAVLERHEPRALLIEGPPEADALVALAADEAMRPPVALLAHVPAEPGRAAFWPLAEFSPEWVAIRWALAHDVPVRFIDLPAAHSLAFGADGEDPAAPCRPALPDGATETDGDGATDAEDGGADSDDGADGGHAGGSRDADRAAEARIDPVAVLAETAGYDDPERWWEDVIEHRAHRRGNGVGSGRGHGAGADTRSGVGAGAGTRSGHGNGGGGGYEDGDGPQDGPGNGGGHGNGSGHGGGDGGEGAAGSDPLAPFEALAEAMEALREAYGTGGHDRDLVREAHMRLRLREARREFGDGIAVVCGAWHVPALTRRTTVTADRQLLKGLARVKPEVTWVPWTHRRLSRRSGYGAGISSPGWYGHLFSAPDRPVERWMTKAAGLLREEDYAVSSAHVIEAVRLAEALAALRGRPLAGLAEAGDAVRAVFGDGSDVPSALIHDRLVVGDVLGEVPDSAPAVPLQRDITRSQRSLRLKPEASDRELDLDLRKETDTGRSRLLHRLRLLGVPWGEPVRTRASTGTFRESWRLRWEPELSVRAAEAGIWGTTVEAAATAKAESAALGTTALADVTALAERCLLAALPDALPVVMRVLTDRAALDADVGHLAQALPALVRSVRYGDVRGTDAVALGEVATGLAERIFVGLPPACTGLDADGAADMRRHLDATHHAVGLLDEGSTSGPKAPAGTASGNVVEAEAVGGRAVGLGAGAEAVLATGAAPGSGTEAGSGDRGGGGLRERWAVVLWKLAERESVPGLLRGRAVRLLLDDGRLGTGDAERLMGLALSPGTPPAGAAGWIEGFAGGDAGGLLLVHDERLLALVDDWLSHVPADAFTVVLPLLRRTFAEFDAGARRMLGELIRRGPARPNGPYPGQDAGRADQEAAVPGFGPGLDRDRAAAVLPTLRFLLGLTEGMPLVGTGDGPGDGDGTGAVYRVGDRANADVRNNTDVRNNADHLGSADYRDSADRWDGADRRDSADALDNADRRGGVGNGDGTGSVGGVDQRGSGDGERVSGVRE
ncbi:DUF5682 family protein [Streptomyces sp. NPDC018045]|uniref:DUF5682 family protein n=1 Tax=Streptomyces sp. NPDC018045 TaxID=3365037 RepID=UPI0037A58EE3